MKLLDLVRLLANGSDQSVELGRSCILRLFRTGDLVVPSGELVACDPFSPYISLRLEQWVAPGQYPVILGIARSDEDERVAFASLRFSEEPPVRLEPARIRDEDTTSDWETLWQGRADGYPVDNGIGCFMDAVAARVVGLSKRGPDFERELLEKLSQTRISTWQWANVTVDNSSGANLIAFSSGLGDGVYKCYWALDSRNRIVNLVTDFEIAAI